jgi:hypothetical protein
MYLVVPEEKCPGKISGIIRPITGDDRRLLLSAGTPSQHVERTFFITVSYMPFVRDMPWTGV